MQVVHEPHDLAPFAGCAFVPTMGALHAGHLALMNHARTLGDRLLISIFVNPTQFSPDEDLEKYPKSLDADLDAARAAGVDVVFAPEVQTMYPRGEHIAPPTLPRVATSPGLEDAHRPGHLAGVCQAVARLFDLVRPGAAVFGEKDYQQLLVIRAMVHEDEHRWPDLQVVGRPTVREADGLALSSRNAYISAADRERARGLFRALSRARDIAAGGSSSILELEAMMRGVLQEHRLDIVYAVIRDALTLEPIDTLPETGGAGGAGGIGGIGGRALIAARLGEVRLIDNMPAQFGESIMSG